ncbi:MAG: SAM-dependent methyltransferase [Pseudomonadota bacterium]
MRKQTMVIRILIIIFMAALAPLEMAQAAPGKFYVVGMGTSPDLITLRGMEVVKSADCVLLEEKSDRDTWKSLIDGKEIWYLGHFSRVYYGIDPETLKDPKAKAKAIQNAQAREVIINKIKQAVEKGQTVAALQWGDPMIYGTTFYLEMLPKDFPSEVIPGIGAFQAASAAVKMSPPYGWDTSSVILTMADWPGRSDLNEKLMALQTSMIFYTMHLDYLKLFTQLNQYYPRDTPVAVVTYAGDREKQTVIRSTVGGFLKEIKSNDLPPELHILMVGKFLTAGQARKEGTATFQDFIRKQHGDDPFLSPR